MEVVKQQLKKMYILLAILYILVFLTLIIFQRSAILSFSFGTVVSAFNLYLTYFAFNKMYTSKKESVSGLLAGPFPKLALIIIGSIICYKFPVFFPIVPFLIGVCLYPIVYLLFGLLDFLTGRKK